MDREEASSESGPGPELSPPLPSIDMPILQPGQRHGWSRAALVRLGLIGTGGAALVAGAVLAGVWLAGTASEEPATTQTRKAAGTGQGATALAGSEAGAGEAAAQPIGGAAPASGAEPQVELAAPPQDPNEITVPFGEARGFRQALAVAGCSREEVAALEEALDDVMDFRRCRPEDRLKLLRTPDGLLERFEFHGRDATVFYRASRTARGAFRGERVERPVRVETVSKGAEIATSLAEAVQRVGLDRTLVPVITSAFERQADFGSDTRAGDVIRLIVDKEYLEDRFLRFGPLRAVRYEGAKTGTIEAFWFQERRDDEGEFWDASGHAVQGGWLRTPCRFDRISSPFDPRRMHPILRRVVPHNGVDYAAGTGTPVWAAAEGEVSFAGVKGANGNLVSIRHDGGFESHYAHLSRIARGIRAGTHVNQRQLIGYVGSTGRSTGPHLHFGLKLRGRFVDPMDHLNGPGRLMRSGVLPNFRRTVRQLKRQLDAITPVRRERGRL